MEIPLVVEGKSPYSESLIIIEIEKLDALFYIATLLKKPVIHENKNSKSFVMDGRVMYFHFKKSKKNCEAKEDGKSSSC